MQTDLLLLACPHLSGPAASPTPTIPFCLALPRSCSLTLQSEVHDAGVQGVHLGAHVGADVDEVHRGPSQGRMGQGTGAQVWQGMQGRGLCWGWRIWGQMCLGLDLVVQGD